MLNTVYSNDSACCGVVAVGSSIHSLLRMILSAYQVTAPTPTSMVLVQRTINLAFAEVHIELLPELDNEVQVHMHE